MSCLGVGRAGVDGAVGERVDYGELLTTKSLQSTQFRYISHTLSRTKINTFSSSVALVLVNCVVVA